MAVFHKMRCCNMVSEQALLFADFQGLMFADFKD